MNHTRLNRKHHRMSGLRKREIVNTRLFENRVLKFAKCIITVVRVNSLNWINKQHQQHSHKATDTLAARRIHWFAVRLWLWLLHISFLVFVSIATCSTRSFDSYLFVRFASFFVYFSLHFFLFIFSVSRWRLTCHRISNNFEYGKMWLRKICIKLMSFVLSVCLCEVI